MRKMAKNAKNRHNFTVKKNLTFLFLIRFGWNLNSILTLSKASFLLIFSILGLKKQKLRFLTKSGYFCDIYARFLYQTKKISSFGKNENIFWYFVTPKVDRWYLGRSIWLNTSGSLLSLLCTESPKKTDFLLKSGLRTTIFIGIPTHLKLLTELNFCIYMCPKPYISGWNH